MKRLVPQAMFALARRLFTAAFAIGPAVFSLHVVPQSADAQFRLPNNFDLVGRYYIDGRTASIESRRGRLVLVNEKREAVRGIRRSRSRISAPEWRTRGTISEGSIFWDNGTVWCRTPNALARLTGRYRIRRRHRVRIIQTGQQLLLFNELGERSTGRFLNATQIVADDWKNLVGTIDGNRIAWANGTTWVADYPDVSGTYSSATGRRVVIRQRGNSLKFYRGRREPTSGVVLSTRTIRAFEGDRRIGVISRGRIRWQDGTTWTRLR